MLLTGASSNKIVVILKYIGPQGMFFLHTPVQQAVESHFKERMNSSLGHLSKGGKHVVDEDMRSLLFGDYMSKDEDKYYDEIRDLDELREVRGEIWMN